MKKKKKKNRKKKTVSTSNERELSPLNLSHLPDGMQDGGTRLDPTPKGREREGVKEEDVEEEEGKRERETVR